MKSFLFVLVLLLVLIVAPAYLVFGHTLHLRSPSFTSGECVGLERVGEFDTYSELWHIDQVGKKQYKMTGLHKDGSQMWSAMGQDVDYVDHEYHKINCPLVSKN